MEREHGEALITGPIPHRLYTLVQKRGFGNVAGHVAITFSGYANDLRESWQIPEIRAYWHPLDHASDEFLTLLAYLPHLGFNGPGQHLMFVRKIDAVVLKPELSGMTCMCAMSTLSSQRPPNGFGVRVPSITCPSRPCNTSSTSSIEASLFAYQVYRS